MYIANVWSTNLGQSTKKIVPAKNSHPKVEIENGLCTFAKLVDLKGKSPVVI